MAIKSQAQTRAVQLELNDVPKTNDFETNVHSNYYSKSSHEFNRDHIDWLTACGVPSKYAPRVASYAYTQGRSHGYHEVMNLSYDLIDIFKD